jgi:hypothetical protein
MLQHREKERLFAEAVALLDPYARAALDELDKELLLGPGTSMAPAFFQPSARWRQPTSTTSFSNSAEMRGSFQPFGFRDECESVGRVREVVTR